MTSDPKSEDLGPATPAGIAPPVRGALLAVICYVLVAGIAANMVTEASGITNPTGRYVVSHAFVPVLVVIGMAMARRFGWASRVWRSTPAFSQRPPRRWLLVVPAILLAQAAMMLLTTPWDRWSPSLVLIGLAVTALVGLGEEFYFRGLLGAALDRRFGTTGALLGTSLAFGLAHAASGALHGEPVGLIVFQVCVTALAGSAFFTAFLATGRLWVPIALHALGDFSLLMSGGSFTADTAATPVAPATIATQAALWLLTVPVFFSCLRHDRRARRAASSNPL